jgi:hypothetical protein
VGNQSSNESATNERSEKNRNREGSIFEAGEYRIKASCHPEVNVFISRRTC